MGYNTTVVVMNDALAEIEKDPNFGKNLAAAISRLSLGIEKRVDVQAANHCNAATVIASHHADVTSVLAVGGNYGRILFSQHNGGHHETLEQQWELLEDALNAKTAAGADANTPGIPKGRRHVRKS